VTVTGKWPRLKMKVVPPRATFDAISVAGMIQTIVFAAKPAGLFEALLLLRGGARG
jgi:hypothetical protein